MGRLILAIVLAPVIWGFISVPINLLIMSRYGDRVGASVPAAELPISYLTIALLLSGTCSIIAGYGAAWIARGRIWQAGLGAGLALLAVGVPVQLSAWETLPVWYHIIFLAALVPFSVLGAWLRGASQANPASGQA